MKGTHSLKFDSIRAHYTRERVAAATTGQEIDQVVRSFLLYLLGTTLFANAASSLDLVFVMPLRDLDLVSSYDLGSYALAYLYRGMDETVRQASTFAAFGMLYWYVVFHYFLSILSTLMTMFTD